MTLKSQIHPVHLCTVCDFDIAFVLHLLFISSIIVAILSGARNSRDYLLSEKVYAKMKTLFSDQKGALIAGSILLCNIYSSIGNHQQAQNSRSTRLETFGKQVKIGLSWTEVNGEIVVRDTFYDQQGL